MPKVAVSRVAIALGGSCPSGSDPRWQLSGKQLWWVAITLGGSGAQSELKCPIPTSTPSFQYFPTPAFPKFPTPDSLIYIT